MLTIIPYNNIHQPGIDTMMLEIVMEFEEEIYSPDSKSIAELARGVNDQYWVALDDSTVIATIGIIVIDNNIGVLKRMMLKKAYRGPAHNAANLLLETVVNWCYERGVTDIYLGTMEQFKAAQRFYEKTGFDNITADNLPPGMPLNPVDTVFYHRKLK